MHGPCLPEGLLGRCLSECSSQHLRNIVSGGAEICRIQLKTPSSEPCLAINLPGRQRTSAGTMSAGTMSRPAYVVYSSRGPRKSPANGALNPWAVFVFGSNSCEMNGWRTLIRAKNETNVILRSAAGPLQWPLRSEAGRAQKLKGCVKNKAPRCNPCFLNPNPAVQIDGKSRLSPFREFWLG